MKPRMIGIASKMPGDPCGRCKKGACPKVCYPQRDWQKHHGKKNRRTSNESV